MPGKQAKILSSQVVRKMLTYAAHSSHPARNKVIILLSVKAGLRAVEIARLDWTMALDPRGRIADVLHVEDAIAKKRAGRRLPLHPDLRRALAQLARDEGTDGPVIKSAKAGAMQANSIVNWFVVMFKALAVQGCSSHSGRRTFITSAARKAHRAGCNLRDVQLLAGHSSIEVTQGYIDGDTSGQRKLVALL